MASNLAGRTVNTLRYRWRYRTRVSNGKIVLFYTDVAVMLRGSFRYFADVFGEFALTARDCAKTSHRKYRNSSRTAELLSANCLDSGWLESPVCPLNRYRVEYIWAEISLFMHLFIICEFIIFNSDAIFHSQTFHWMINKIPLFVFAS